MKIFFRHYVIFGGFPAGFRPPPMAGKIRAVRAVEPIWCAGGALAKGTLRGNVCRMQKDYFRAFALKPPNK
jgi:hypothetical protein